jgi:transcriptional regulator with XRE-family HTH domain
MHALGCYLQEEMDARGWRQADLARASGLSRQVVSLLVTQQELRAMIRQPTIEALSRALGVDETIIISKAAEAIGVPVDKLAPVVLAADDVSDDVLLEILRKRLKRASVTTLDGHELDSMGEFANQTEAASATNTTQAAHGDGDQLGVNETTARIDSGPRGRKSHGSDKSDAAERSREQPSKQSAPPVL